MIRQKPFIVELTGTPEAGKTTIINLLYQKLSDLGYKVRVYPESAEESKSIFPRESNNPQDAKLWMNVLTLKHLIEAPYQPYDIILFDRGAVDRIFWIYLDILYNNFDLEKECSLELFFRDYFPDQLIIFKVSIEEAIKRRGGEGHVVTREFLNNYNRLLDSFINSIRINKHIVCTDNMRIDEVLDVTTNLILESIKNRPS